ncbi:MAG: hybrid sensor histidine kinase/response regulator, partial [Proteobacteria bacterium]|nr:hybrid sensor histidine kinase/response regulator [Pseudomonadota bacterium]
TKEKLLLQKENEQTRLGVYEVLQRSQTKTEMLIESRELADFLSVSEDSTYYSSNILYGKIRTLLSDNNEINNFVILKNDNKPAYIDKNNLSEKELATIVLLKNGFSVLSSSNIIYYKDDIRFDDQFITSSNSRIRGKLITFISIDKIKSKFPNIKNIKSLSSKLTTDSINIEVNKDKVTNRPPTLIYILILFFILAILSGYGLVLVKSKILMPIEALIAFIKNKTDQATTISEKNELVILQKMINNYIDYERKTQKKLTEQSKLVAIGQMTQILAHDVRKPFSMLKIILNMFDKFSSTPSLLNSAKVDIEKAIANVESMLNDIMDFSRGVKVEVNANSVLKLLDFSIRQTAQAYQYANISLEYDIQNKQKPLVDDERLTRVFGNIISNAIEAITIIGQKERGNIFISSNDVKIEDRYFVEIIIANNGPPFDEKDIPNLFESFFTKGKRKGTGLGLASAYKIVMLHDGIIKARNIDINKTKLLNWQQNEGVEFIIDIPASNEKEQKESISLPNNIKDAVFVELKRNTTEIDKLIERFSQKQKNFKVLLLEDEALYRASVKNIIKKNENLNKMLTLYDVTTVEEGLDVIMQEEITHAIVDIDLGDVMDGFGFIKKIKNNYPNISCMDH